MAGYRDLVAKMAQAGIAAAGDLKERGTYTAKTGTPVYDAALDEMVGVVTTLNSVPMVLSSFKINEADSTVVITTDQKCTIAALDLPGVAPAENDKISVIGRTWNVKRVMSPPSGPIWVLHLRAD